MKFIAALDQGTSSTRFMLFTKNGKLLPRYCHQQEFEQIYPNPGWVEHNPQTILDSCSACIQAVVQKLAEDGYKDPSEVISAVGITNQRETCVCWDSITGKPLHNAIVWMDTRTLGLVNTLISSTTSQDKFHFADICGLPISTYFSAVKLRWMLDNVPAVASANNEGRLMFGTIDTWLTYNFTGGANNGVHVTDVSNASRTMLMDLRSLQWDSRMLEFFGVKKECLPSIKSSSEVYGKFSTDWPWLTGTRIGGILGDQQAALLGNLCLSPGMLKNTYGTGCFMLCNTGTTPPAKASAHGLLNTVAFKLGQDAPAYYALEGSIAIAGAGVKWLRDNLGIIKSSEEVGELASKVPDSGGCIFVPAFTGLFAPYWRPEARGMILGLTQYTTKNHICRALLEAISFQTRDIIDAMQKDSGIPKLSKLAVDGGMSACDELMRIQADVAECVIVRPKMRETTALGAALAAGRAVGEVDFQGLEGESFDMFAPSGAVGPSLKKWHEAIQ